MKPAPAHKLPRQTAAEPAYDRDYFGWVSSQAIALRQHRAEALDWENLREEVEDLGAALKRELRSRLKIILIHLLKFRYQARKQSVSWENTLLEQRAECRDLLEENPSLKLVVPELLAKAYRYARPAAGSEMRLAKEEWLALFPARCPWAAGQVLDDDFVPGLVPGRPRRASR